MTNATYHHGSVEGRQRHDTFRSILDPRGNCEGRQGCGGKARESAGERVVEMVEV